MSRRQIIVMGVSGSGKSTVAEMLARELGWSFAEGDDFHSEENVRKMAAGSPLTDEDRLPWLRSIRDWMAGQATDGHDSVVACSALKRAYRDVLREGSDRVTFVFLAISQEALEARLAERAGHFMPATLLESQRRTLEPPGDDEDAIAVDADQPAPEIAAEILRRLSLQEPE